jgi:hypothetical protein
MKYGTEESDWYLFLKGIWKYQWIKHHADLDESLSEAMYDFSQGITDIAVKLFMMAQWRVMLDKTEKITPNTLKSILDNELSAFKPVIEAIRLNDPKLLDNAMDLFYTEMNMEQLYDAVVKQMAKKAKASGQDKIIEEEVDPKEKAKEAVRWLIEGGFNPHQADKAVRTIMKMNPKILLPELKNEAFQACQKVTKQAERRAKNIPLPSRKGKINDGIENSQSIADLSGDVVAAGGI